jgi:hypothetical protein
MDSAVSQKFVRSTLEEARMNDALIDALEARIVALEEVVAARGIRRLWAAWRLGRALRASVRHIAGRSFAERRFEAAATEWVSEPLAGEDRPESPVVGPGRACLPVPASAARPRHS